MFSVTLDSVVHLSVTHRIQLFFSLSHTRFIYILLITCIQPRFERGNPHSLNPALAVFSNRFPLERIRD